MGTRTRGAIGALALVLVTVSAACGFVGNDEAGPRNAEGSADPRSTTPTTAGTTTPIAPPPTESTTTTTKPPRVAVDPALQPACDALVYLRDTLENLFALGNLDDYHAAAEEVLAAIATINELVPPDILRESSTEGTQRVIGLMESIQQTTSLAELQSVLDAARASGDTSLEGSPRFGAWFQESCPTV